ncbi:hypothetical protein PPL_02929 [Heterostelium album PN500]|uniref:Uncharacterized protein n=1 Tax=Heterostelium pallidum (strain ATCC 26659 / Pp 5 / PN500) TaxID=670386 RepID=D3B3G1_HETP5|nr:hypothetical protein PPL_02929 [Heterostelium album PN500]EFA83859.1 hypothetical protein PPL_02929 [Heterostelium album PN500]|eukprot:XP_020435976.1 hypothetical protein PPL_02929 [Heterostelium album PN500]
MKLKNIKGCVYSEYFDYSTYMDGNPNIEIPPDVGQLVVLDKTIKYIPNLSQTNVTSMSISMLEPEQELYIEPGSLPHSLKSLTLSVKIQDTLEPGLFPEGLQSITIDDRNNQFFKPNVLPESLESLQLLSEYDKPFESGSLPSRLKTLTILFLMGNQDLSHLPKSLECIEFGEINTFKLLPDFNQFHRLATLQNFQFEHIHLVPPTVRRQSILAPSNLSVYIYWNI